uniref:Uncharacterized protein n=1 Tax=Noctiluca scintillans TaxID=2966 RepID=A0A7S1F4K8_NOCSC|mmetsp:Transcript_31924/g.85437  ORF Transcript_31924/g.85437 Transcript_31924/m.85437 type:complete len:118 (+) Transcript_31924:149-502(+)
MDISNRHCTAPSPCETLGKIPWGLSSTLTINTAKKNTRSMDIVGIVKVSRNLCLMVRMLHAAFLVNTPTDGILDLTFLLKSLSGLPLFPTVDSDLPRLLRGQRTEDCYETRKSPMYG